MLQSIAVCCSVLMCVDVCCTLFAVMALRKSVKLTNAEPRGRNSQCSVLQCVAVCCYVLQCVAVCCGVLQCVDVCCTLFAVMALRKSVKLTNAEPRGRNSPLISESFL